MGFIGRTILAAGAAALLSAQTAYAAPTTSASTGVDPLVSLSVLGTAQSRAAVCGAASAAGAACVAPASMATAAATTAAAQGDPTYRRPQIGVIPLLIGLGLVIAVAALILSGNGHSKGNLTPVSP